MIPCENCVQPTPTSGGSASLLSSQVRPSATSGRESIVGSITSGEDEAPTCTDCEHGSSASAPHSRYGSGTPNSGSSGHAGYSTASSLGPFPQAQRLRSAAQQLSVCGLAFCHRLHTTGGCSIAIQTTGLGLGSWHHDLLCVMTPMHSAIGSYQLLQPFYTLFAFHSDCITFNHFRRFFGFT